MTIVMTILASDNARNRRRAKRAAERNTSVTGCADRVLKAVSCTDYKMKMRSKHVPEAVTREKAEYRKVVNPYGQITNARQKMRGKSIPLI